MTRRRRILLGAGVFVLLLLVGTAAMLAWVTTTRSGFDWALERARGYLPEQVEFAQAEGRLIGPITVRGLRVRTEGARLRVDEVQLRWRPQALLSGRVEVAYLGLHTVAVETTPTETQAETGPAELPPEIDLPLPVTVDRLVVADATLSGPDAEPQRLERLSTRIEADARALTINELELSSPMLDVEARLRIGTAQPYPVAGRIDWQGRPPEPLAPMAGRLDLGGNLEALQLRQRWNEPAEATLTAELRLFASEPRWQAQLDLLTAPVTAWSSAAPDLGVGAQLELNGSFEQASVSGAVDLTGLPTGPVRARLAAAGEFAARRVVLERLRVEPTRPGAWLAANGTAALEEGGPRFDLSLAWHDLAWPLTAGSDPVATSESGRFELAGTPEGYRFDGDARAWSPALGEDTAELQWSGNGSTERLEQFAASVNWRGARLETDGALDWAETQDARVDFRLEGLDPGRFSPDLSGRLQARGNLQAQWGGVPRVAVDLQNLSGALNGRPVEGHGRGAWREGRLRLDEVDLAAGDARLQAMGGVEGERVDVDWSLEVPQLSQLLPQVAGSLQADGSVTGDPTAPSARFRLQGDGLSIGEAHLASLRASGEIAEAGSADSRVGLQLRDIQAGGVRADTLALGLRGSRGDHRLVLELAAPRGDAAIALAGAFDGDWQGRLEQADLSPAQGPSWQLNEPAELAWRDPRFELARACWTADGAARVCAEGAGQAGAWQASLDAASIPLALVANPWRDDLRYEGELGLRVDVSQDGGPVTGEARLDVTPGRVAGTIGDMTTDLIEFGAGRVEATLAEERVDAMLELALADGGELAASVGIERAAPHPLAGRVRAALGELDLAAELVPQIGEIEGGLSADLELSGTLAEPGVSGEAELRAEQVSLPEMGVRLTQVELLARTAERSLTAEASMRSGEGRLGATVELAHEGERGWQGSGTVSGEDFTVADVPELHATIAPDLQWRIDGRDISIDGRVEIPTARIEPRDLSSAVQASPDAVVVRESAPGSGMPAEPEEIEGWQVSADVRVVLGDQVRINAFGLDADLGGAIRIVQRPGQLTNASGDLSVVEGTYSIYGQTLTIERGRVLFASGPLSDPGLDVRAVRRPRDVLVGVNVRGTLRRPRVELFSEPPMEESQVLSYLVVGMPLNETSSGERTSVAAAAAALASSRRGERMAQGLGIDEVTLEEEEQGEGASLVLGRYLSPRLYVGYGIGLLEQADSVRVRYELTRQWTVETRSGATSSADLLYSIESDE